MAAVEVEGLRVRRGGKLVLPGLDLTLAAGRLTGLLRRAAPGRRP